MYLPDSRFALGVPGFILLRKNVSADGVLQPVSLQRAGTPEDQDSTGGRVQHCAHTHPGP